MSKRKWISMRPQPQNSIERRYKDSKQKVDRLKSDLEDEKSKNNELRRQINECEKKLHLNTKVIYKIKKLKDDYEILAKSFRYSEQIRNKQKDIIQVLNLQIDKAKSRHKI